MIGEKNKEEKLFYYLRPEDLIPEDHILGKKRGKKTEKRKTNEKWVKNEKRGQV